VCRIRNVLAIQRIAAGINQRHTYAASEDDLLGLVLHPFDLAINKVLALTGHLDTLDWIDVLNCPNHIQALAYLVWVACGKDPGFSLASLIAAAQRSRGKLSAIGEAMVRIPAADQPDYVA
jgi:hypothetical protein